MSSLDKLQTLICVKTDPEMLLPVDKPAYLVLAGNGLWMCRNHEFFCSSVPARNWPSGLAPHAASLELNHPKIPQAMFEQIVGFCSVVAQRHGAEAGVLLIWNRNRREMELIVPAQLATVSRSYSGATYPIGLHYEVPNDLGPGRVLLGDIHSHVYEEAYSSQQDKSDEEYRPGLHFVIGRLDRESPQFHAEYVVDGTRFDVDPQLVLEGYHERSVVIPAAWLDQVSIKTYDNSKKGKSHGSYSQSNSSSLNSTYGTKYDEDYRWRYVSGRGFRSDGYGSNDVSPGDHQSDLNPDDDLEA